MSFKEEISEIIRSNQKLDDRFWSFLRLFQRRVGEFVEKSELAEIIRNNKPKDGEKGDKGDKGDRGERGEKGEKGEKGIDGGKGEKGDKGDKGEDGLDGRDGVSGKDGKDGEDGKDGSPDKPEDIRDKLQSLLGFERLDASAIKNLPQPSTRRGGGGTGDHNLLSNPHADTTAGSVSRGAIMTGQGASPSWAALVIGAANRVLKSDGTDVSWGQVDLTADVTGTLPLTSGGVGATTAAGARTNLNVDVAGTDNSTNVTLITTTADYLSISGQEITLGLIDLATDVTGVLPIANGGTNSSAGLTNNQIMVSSSGAVVEGGAMTNGQLMIGSTGAAPVVAGLTGTANQITVTGGAGSITLSTPQDIGTGSSPTFEDLTLNGDLTVGDGVGNVLITVDSGTNGVAEVAYTEAGTTRWRFAYNANLNIFTFRDQQNLTNPFIISDGSDDGLLHLNGSNIGIASSSPSGKLHVDQPSTTGAKPVLLLDQADVSEEFIRFIGTAAASTLTQSIVAEADVTTATRQGFVRVFVQDDGNQITDQAYYMPIFTLA